MYGSGTRSYLRSTEHRENKRQVAETTAKYRAGELKLTPCVLLPVCTCRSFELPHEISRHAELSSDYDWRKQSERHTFHYRHPVK